MRVCVCARARVRVRVWVCVCVDRSYGGLKAERRSRFHCRMGSLTALCCRERLCPSLVVASVHGRGAAAAAGSTCAVTGRTIKPLKPLCTQLFCAVRP
jgi:hypothetical protein